MAMRLRVTKWGNSLGLRIPASLAREMGLSDGATLELEREDDHIVLRPVRFTLEELLERVTPENQHAELPIGKRVGRESW